MGTYIARRLVLMIPTVIGITFLVFMLIAMSPGGIGAALRVSSGGQMEATSRAMQEAYLEDRYGLDDPVLVQYLRWLGRISPVKFGTRDQMTPAGDRIRPPKELKPPKVWKWFAGVLPSPDAAPSPGASADPEARVREHRMAAQEYARKRAVYVAANVALEDALADYARVPLVGLAHAVSGAGKVRASALEGHQPIHTVVKWTPLSKAGARAIAAYGEALKARARLAAAFEARPFEEPGIPLIPGMIWLDAPDFGVSFSRGRPVIDLITVALPVTIMLNLMAFPIIYGVAVPAGMLAATRRGTILDTGSGVLFIALYSIPVVLAGVLAVGFVANRDYLGWFPVAGLHDPLAEGMTFLPSTRADGAWERGWLLDTLWHVCLPVTCLVYTGFAVLSKQTRAAMLDNFSADFVRTAKAKGVSGKNVVLRHVFRNSLLPLITIFATIFPAMLAGSVVIERVFSVPGMGSLLIEAITLRDREVILANALIISVVNLLALLLADILYALADPRVTYE